jgi:hypothetical protein
MYSLIAVPFKAMGTGALDMSYCSVIQGNDSTIYHQVGLPKGSRLDLEGGCLSSSRGKGFRA